MKKNRTKEIEAINFLIEQGHQVCWDATIWAYEDESGYVVTPEGFKSAKEGQWIFDNPKKAAEKYLQLVEKHG